MALPAPRTPPRWPGAAPAAPRRYPRCTTGPGRGGPCTRSWAPDVRLRPIGRDPLNGECKGWPVLDIKKKRARPKTDPQSYPGEDSFIAFDDSVDNNCFAPVGMDIPYENCDTPYQPVQRTGKITRVGQISWYPEKGTQAGRFKAAGACPTLIPG